MSYSTLNTMRQSPGLMARIVACAAQEGSDSPEGWAQTNSWNVISGSDWVDAYAYAEDTKTVNVNPDTGARDDVITDTMILASVQAVKGAQTV